MTSKTNNEEYRGEPLDREEPSVNLNSDNEEPEDLDCPNCCEPFSDSRPATPACPNPACPHTICQPCLDKWKSSSDLCMYCRQASGDRRFHDLHRVELVYVHHVMARQYLEREMLHREMVCVPDYLNVPDPDDVDTVTVTSEEADGLIKIFDRIVRGGRRGSVATFARVNRPLVRRIFPDATPRAVSDALVFAYATTPEETKEEKYWRLIAEAEQKARRLVDEAATSSADLPDAETLSASCGVAVRYASLYNDEEEHKTDDIAEAIGTCHRLAAGKTRLSLVGAYNVAKYIAEHCANTRTPPSRRAEALQRLNLRGINNSSALQFFAFARIIDKHGAHKFLYTCSVPWREVRELLPGVVLARAFVGKFPKRNEM